MACKCNSGLIIKIQAMDNNKDVELIQPTRAHNNDLGVDLYYSRKETVTLKAQSLSTVSLGYKLHIDDTHGFILKDRSSMALKGIHSLAGVIDPDYLGEIRAVFYNFNTEDYVISYGDKIIQAIICNVIPATVSVETIEPTQSNKRLSNGFGSTGKSKKIVEV